MIYVPGCRLLVKPIALEELDKDMRMAKQLGLVLPDVEKRKQQTLIDRGTVLQIGPNASDEYIAGVEVGSLIGFTKFGGKFVKDINGDDEFLIINDEDVICVFKE